MSSKTTNLNLTKPSEDEFYDINVQNENMDIIDREINGLKQPAYEVSTAMSDLNSGEMITVAFGKIAKAVSTLISHVANKSNPHGVTKNQIGLGNVPNVATNDQTPTYTEASSLSSLVSGEKTSVAFGKIAKAVSTLISHTTSKATNSVLGHVKLSDSTSSTSASTAGVAATPKAVKAAYDLANSNTEKLGTTDISGIGDGTVTGAIVNNKEAIEDVSQSLTNINKSKKTYLRLVLPNVAADAKTVCDYINKNYLLGQLSPATTVDFDVVASNADWFTGTLSTDSTALVAGRTVWGIVQQRTSSVENSTLYKYFASGTGGAGSVSPFKSYDQGYAQGVTDADNRANANSTNYKTGYNNGYNAGKSDGALTGVSGCCIAGWRSIDAYSNNQWVSGWTGVNPNYFTVNGYGIVPKRNFTATVYWQGYNKRDIDFYSNGVMGHRDNGTSMNGVKMNFYAGTQCGFKTNDSGGGSLGAGFIVLN